MAGIQEYLDLIKNAVYGREVRQAIHDGIYQCYEDGRAGAIDLVAREEIAQLIAPSGEAPSAAEVTDARIGADGKTYASLGVAIREQVSHLEDDLSTSTDNIFDISPFTLYEWTRKEDEVSGRIGNLNGVKFMDDYEFKENTPYTLQLFAYNEGNASVGTENGLRIRIYYTDGSYKQQNYANSVTSFAYSAIVSDASKTISYIQFYYANEANSIWHLKGIMLSEGDKANAYNTFRSSEDTVARNMIDRMYNDFELTGSHSMNEFVWGDMEVVVSSNGWVLDGTGTSKRDSGGSLCKVEVSEGQILWISADKYSDAGVYQFQSGDYVGGSGKANPQLIGKPINETFNGAVVVPKGATHLFLTRNKNNPTDIVRRALFRDGTHSVLPSYWQKYIDDKAKAISRDATPPIGSGMRFAFITDVHLRNANGTLRNAGWSPLLMKYLHEHCNIGTAFFGGDTLTGGYSDLNSAIDDLSLFRNTFSPVWSWMHCVFGNHEYGNNASELSPLDKSIIYNHLIRDKERQYSEVNPIYGSYILDNKAEKIRFICVNLNEGNNLNQQNDFFCNAMKETPSGWTIVYITHFSIEKINGIDHIATKLTNTGSIIPAIEAYNARQVYGSFDFTDAEAEVACVIGGHSHYDGMVETSGGVPVISTTCDMYTDIDGMTAGTTTEQAFDVFSIDTSAKTIKAIRIGFGSDRLFTYGN